MFFTVYHSLLSGLSNGGCSKSSPEQEPKAHVLASHGSIHAAMGVWSRLDSCGGIFNGHVLAVSGGSRTIHGIHGLPVCNELHDR